MMYVMEYLIYHLRPYGIDSMAHFKNHDLNQLPFEVAETSFNVCDPEKDADCKSSKKEEQP